MNPDEKLEFPDRVRFEIVTPEADAFGGQLSVMLGGFSCTVALSFIENRCYGLALSEYHTGMMAYSRRALHTLPWEFVSDTFHFDGEMAMLAGRRGLRIREVPIPHVYGDERSHVRPIRYGFTVLAIAVAVRLGLYDRWVERRAARVASA